MAWFVSIDLSANPGSVSLFRGDAATPTSAVLMEEVCMGGAMKHSEEFFGCLNALLLPDKLKASDISEWWVNEGPGSFTGLRIALAAVKGIVAGEMPRRPEIVLVNGAEARARSWLRLHPEYAGTVLKVCTTSTSTRFLCHSFRVGARPEAELELVGHESVESMPPSTAESVVLTDVETAGEYWPSQSSALLMAQTFRKISDENSVAAATPVYYAAREFAKQAASVGVGKSTLQ